MKRARFTDEQAIGIQKERESHQKTADGCRKRGKSESAFFKCKGNTMAVDVLDVHKLKAVSGCGPCGDGPSSLHALGSC